MIIYFHIEFHNEQPKPWFLSRILKGRKKQEILQKLGYFDFL